MWSLKSYADGREYPITSEGISIGREGCDVPVPDSDRQASRQHAIVRLRGDMVEVEDCDSKNGTFLGPFPVTSPTPWSPDVTLRCGTTSFQLIQAASAAKGATIVVDDLLPPKIEGPVSAPPPVRTATSATPTRSPNPPASRRLAPPDLGDEEEELIFDPPAQEMPLTPAAVPASSPSSGFTAPSAVKQRGAWLSQLVIGSMLLVVGLLWWQYFQGQLETLDRLLIQSPVRGDVADMAADMRRSTLYAAGAVLLACLGGLVCVSGILQMITVNLRKYRG